MSCHCISFGNLRMGTLFQRIGRLFVFLPAYLVGDGSTSTHYRSPIIPQPTSIVATPMQHIHATQSSTHTHTHARTHAHMRHFCSENEWQWHLFVLRQACHKHHKYSLKKILAPKSQGHTARRMCATHHTHACMQHVGGAFGTGAGQSTEVVHHGFEHLRQELVVRHDAGVRLKSKAR